MQQANKMWIAVYYIYMTYPLEFRRLLKTHLFSRGPPNLVSVVV